MSGSIIAELILQPIFEAIFYVGGYYVGRLVVPVISFGRWKCEPLLREVRRKKPKWGGTYHRRGQQIYLTSEGTACVGVLFILLIGCLYLLWWSLK